MKTIFIIGPYAASAYEQKCTNINIAATAAKFLWKRDWAAICPHMNSAMFDDIASEDAFYEGYQSILRSCSAAFILPHWDSSKGSLREISIAARFHIPIKFTTKVEPFSLSPQSINLLRRFVKQCRKEDFYEPTAALAYLNIPRSITSSKYLVSRGTL